MKKILFFACLLIALFGTAQLRAESNDPAQGQGINIYIYNHPQDFTEAQQLAAQNRVDRINSLQDTIKCIHLAQNMDDIRTCQRNEHDSLEKIRLVYCKTSIARPLKETGKEQADTTLPAECDKAASAVTGTPIAPDTTDLRPNAAK